MKKNVLKLTTTYFLGSEAGDTTENLKYIANREITPSLQNNEIVYFGNEQKCDHLFKTFIENKFEENKLKLLLKYSTVLIFIVLTFSIIIILFFGHLTLWKPIVISIVHVAIMLVVSNTKKLTSTIKKQFRKKPSREYKC